MEPRAHWWDPTSNIAASARLASQATPVKTNSKVIIQNRIIQVSYYLIVIDVSSNAACGGLMVGLNGTIAFPANEDSPVYAHEVSCQ